MKTYYNSNMKEKIENFWFYNKTYVMLGIVVLAALLWIFRPNGNEEEAYDFCVGIIAPRYYDDSQIETLKEALSSIYGKTNVLCYHVALGEYNQDSIEIARLDIDLNTKISGAFLAADPKTFIEVTNADFSTPRAVLEIDELKGLGFDDLSLVSRLDY